jgi:hypothetical protein
MNWRRGLFRLWIFGTALFLIAVALISYSDIKAEFDAASKRDAKLSSILAANPKAADILYNKLYSDMPRDQFDKEITGAKPVTELTKRLDAFIATIDTSRSRSQWSDDEQVADSLTQFVPATNPWESVGMVAGLAFGIPLAVLILGACLVWAFSGFSAKQP